MAGCGELVRISPWCLVAKRGMRPLGVVVGDPATDELAGLVEIEKDCLVEELVAHPAVKALDEAVLHRFAGRDVVPFDLMIDCPAEDRVRGELGAVVANTSLREG